MRLKTKLALSITLLALALLPFIPVRSQEVGGRITITVNPDGSMNVEADLRVTLPSEITDIEGSGTISYNPSANESVVQGAIDIAFDPSISAMLPISNVNVSFTGTEMTATGTLGLELLPSEQIPVKSVWATLSSQTDAAGNVTTINADGYYTVAYVRPWSKENITELMVLLQSQVEGIALEMARGTNNAVEVTKLEFGPQPELFDTYAKSTFSATILLSSSQLMSLPGTPVSPDVLSKIIAITQERNLARLRTWQAKGTYSAIASKIEASFSFSLMGDIDSNLNAAIEIYKELARSGAITGLDTALMPLFDTEVSVKGSSFNAITSQGELRINVVGIVLKPPVERTATGFHISPDYMAAAVKSLPQDVKGLEMAIKGKGVEIKVSPEAPKPATATSSEVVWPDFNVNVLSYLEFTTAPAVTSTTTPTTSALTTATLTTVFTTTSATAGPSGPEPLLLVVITVVAIVIVVMATVLLLRRRKQTSPTTERSSAPVQS
ncbi:MAG: hypothetical protein OEY99_04200 [Aigarchaeota archaeon]|nr:hypothetical protein [Aigarchaeota archaeon]MDH5703394.1 hypothetical protein [Aigarchaeota archaeon]